MTKILPITKAREKLTTLVENASRKLDEYVITVKGSPAAVLMSAAEFESWKETLDILADAPAIKALKQAEADFKQDKFVTFDQLKADLKLDV